MVQRKDVKTEEIVRLYQSGLIGREIAEKLGCSVALVQQRLFRAGTKMRPSNDRITVPIDKTVLKEMYWDKQMHPAEIGKVFGIHKNTVIKKMHEFGIASRSKSEARKGDLNPIYGIGHTQSARQRMSDVVADGTKDLSISHLNPYGKKVKSYGKTFRSTWEFGFARYLNEQGIEWLYEKHRLRYFHRGIERTYIPDFYLPKGFIGKLPCFVEVKGFCDEEGKDKLAAIKASVKNLVVLYREDLIELGIIDASGKIIIEKGI